GSRPSASVVTVAICGWRASQNPLALNRCARGCMKTPPTLLTGSEVRANALTARTRVTATAIAERLIMHASFFQRWGDWRAHHRRGSPGSKENFYLGFKKYGSACFDVDRSIGRPKAQLGAATTVERAAKRGALELGCGHRQIGFDRAIGRGSIDPSGHCTRQRDSDAAVRRLEPQRFSGGDLRQLRANVAVGRLGIDIAGATQKLDVTVGRRQPMRAADIADIDRAIGFGE